MTNRFEETPKVNPESSEKTVAASRVRMNELVMPNDTNPLGNLMGGAPDAVDGHLFGDIGATSL